MAGAVIFAGLLYAYVLLLVVLLFGSVYYSYRIMRLVGAIKSWIMMIIALLLIAFDSLISFVHLLSDTPAAIAESLQGVSPVGLLVSLGYDLALSVLFFGAMFGLHTVFKRSQKP